MPLISTKPIYGHLLGAASSLNIATASLILNNQYVIPTINTEHVVEPDVVVAEIFRVLKEGGLVYAETPFMQQVHEGAYDFTRFTVLGHRYLFKAFEAIDFGGNKGPEVVFAWAARYLAWSLTRSRKIGRIVGVAVGLLMRPLEPLVSKESMHDASSGVYFLGRKVGKHSLSHKDLVALYKGQFN